MSTSIEIPTKLEHRTEVLSSGTVAHNWPLPEGHPRATLLFHHGFADYSERWVRDYPFLVPSLHALRMDVWAIDMRGHGRSPGKRSIVRTNEAVDDHIELRRRLTSKGRRLYTMGHSLGGLITADSTSRSPNDLAGTILLAPALLDPNILLRRLVACVASIFPTRQIPPLGSSLDGLSRNNEFVEKWLRDDQVFHGQVSFLLATTSLETMAGLWPRLSQWFMPTLVIHGTKDNYTEHDQSRKLCTMISSIDKEFKSIEEGRHDVLSDTGHEETWQLVLSWLESRISKQER